MVRAPALLRRQRAAATLPPCRLAPSRALPTPAPRPRASQVVQTLYLVVTTLIMGLELLTVVNAKPTGAIGDYTVTINATLAGDDWRWVSISTRILG